MKIRMLTTERGSIDGVRVASYAADQEYDLTTTPGARALAEAFVGAGLAEEVGADRVPSKAELMEAHERLAQIRAELDAERERLYVQAAEQNTERERLQAHAADLDTERKRLAELAEKLAAPKDAGAGTPPAAEAGADATLVTEPKQGRTARAK
jgi:predicted nuclease with TOPRIM domain